MKKRIFTTNVVDNIVVKSMLANLFSLKLNSKKIRGNLTTHVTTIIEE